MQLSRTENAAALLLLTLVRVEGGYAGGPRGGDVLM